MDEGAGIEGVDGIVGDEVVVKGWVVWKDRVESSGREFGVHVEFLKNPNGECTETGQGVFLAGILFCTIGSCNEIIVLILGFWYGAQGAEGL